MKAASSKTINPEKKSRKRKFKAPFPKQRPPAMVFAARLITLILILSGILAYSLPILSFPYITAAFAGAAAGIICGCTAFIFFEHRGWIYGGSIILIIFTALQNIVNLIEGAMYSANILIVAYTNMYPKFGSFILLPTAEREYACGVFMFFLLWLLALLFSWIILFHYRFFPCAIMIIPVFMFITDLYGLVNPTAAVMIIGGFMAMLLKGQAARHTASSARVSIIAASLSVLYLTGIILVLPVSEYKPLKKALETRQNITEIIEDIAVELPFGTISGTYAGAPMSSRSENVDLSTTGELRFNKKTALRVKGFEGKYLLRGFSASEYTGHSWTQVSDEVYPEKGFGFEPQTYMPLSMFDAFSGSVGSMEVEVKSAAKSHLYTPYFLAETTIKGKPASFYKDSMLKGKWTIRSYTSKSFLIDGSFEKTRSVINNIIPIIYNIPDSENITTTCEIEDKKIKITIYDNKNDATLHLTYSDSYGMEFEYGENMTDEIIVSWYPYITDFESWAANRNSDDKEYLEFIKREYTKIPEDLKQKLLSINYYLDSFYYYNLPLNDTQWSYAAENVASFMQSFGEYTTKPGPQPADTDFVDYFITTSKKGYCMHYASAATMMLRAMGIPARYVEGYAVPDGKAGEWRDVPSKNAHAWTEYWLPGAGWMPLEVTPGGSPSEQAANTSRPGGSSSKPASKPESRPDTSRPNTPPQSRSTSAAKNIKQQTPLWVTLFITIGGALIFAAIVLFTRVSYLRQRWKKRFRTADLNQAALAGYTYLTELSKYGYEIPVRAKTTAEKAMFSRDIITPAELNNILELIPPARKTTFEHTKPHIRARMIIKGL